MTRPMRGAALAAALLAGLSACSDDEDPALAGERRPLRPAAEELDAAAPAERRPVPPAAAASADWTQTGGGPERPGGHLAAPASLSLVWNVDAGADVGDRAPGGGPIVVGGRVFLRDGGASVLAFDAGSGARLWETDLTPEAEDPDEGHGGGVALSDGVLVATTGFGEMVGLDPADGAVRWRLGADAPFRAPPAAGEGLAVAVARSHEAFAADLASGERLWTVASAMRRPGALAGAAPALARGVAALPFGTGELILARTGGGVTVWSQALISPASAEGMGAFPDVTSDPVIGRAPGGAPIIVAANAGGALAAFEGVSGRRLWQRGFGSLSPAWVAGDSLFVATTEPRLTRLDLLTGRTLWSVALERFGDPDDREDPITHAGPVLAGGRLLTTSSDGALSAFDPETGALMAEVEVPGGASLSPVIAGGVVYVLTDDGHLLAYR